MARRIRQAATPLRLPPGLRDREQEGLHGQPQTSAEDLDERKASIVTHKATKRSRTGSSDTDPKRLEAEHQNHVFVIDYQDHQTATDRRLLRYLNMKRPRFVAAFF